MNLEAYPLTSSEGYETMQSERQKSQWRRCRHHKSVAPRTQVVAATLKGREMVTYRLNFSDTRLSCLTAWGEGNIDLYVFDQDGEMIAFDNGANRQAHCAWLAASGMEYRVWLVNNERYAVTCSLGLQAR